MSKKNSKIYWCCICDKIHRVSSKIGKEHYDDNHIDYSNGGHHCMSVIPCKTIECHLEAVKTKYHVDGAWFKQPDGSKVWKGAGLIAKEKEKWLIK